MPTARPMLQRARGAVALRRRRRGKGRELRARRTNLQQAPGTRTYLSKNISFQAFSFLTEGEKVHERFLVL